MVKKKGLKKFNISNKLAYTLIVILSIALLGVGVIAYDPNLPWHSAGQIAWPTCGANQVLAISGGDAVCVNPLDTRFTINSQGQLCWPSVCAITETLCDEEYWEYVDLASTCESYDWEGLEEQCRIALGSISNFIVCQGDDFAQCGGGTYTEWQIEPHCVSPTDLRVYCRYSVYDYYNQEVYTPGGTACITGTKV